MKTYTITLHDTDNCGSSLQAYALQQFLLKNNIENEIIDYVPQYIKYNGSKLRTIAKKILYFVPTIQKDRKFAEFKKSCLRVTNTRYSACEEIEKANLVADCFITGSDQLWNDTFQCGRDSAYYLDFTKQNKIAYAVSLGKEKISSNNQQTIRSLASEYKWISVREPSGVSVVGGLVDVPVMHVCDPVFLHEKDTYSAIAKKVDVGCKYILVYLAQAVDKDAMNATLEILKSKRRCKVVLIGTCVKKCDCDIHLKSVSPREFLYLIENAEYVISNSFHATMFSLIFEKQFATLLPKENGTRITSVLERLGIENRGLTKPQYIESEIKSEEYKAISSALRTFAKESGEHFLQQLDALKQR